jgi:hypothetical protein
MFPAGQRIDMRDPHERTVVLVGITLPQELQIARQLQIAQRSSRPVHSGARLRFRSWGNGLAYLLFGLGPGQKISDDTKGESARALSPFELHVNFGACAHPCYLAVDVPPDGARVLIRGATVQALLPV